MTALNRGGVPHVFREAITTAGRYHGWPFWSKYLIIRVADFPCKVYFTKEDFDADENYILVPVAAAATPYGEIQGPFETEGIHLKGSGGTSTVELVAFQRRG